MGRKGKICGSPIFGRKMGKEVCGDLTTYWKWDFWYLRDHAVTYGDFKDYFVQIIY